MIPLPALLLAAAPAAAPALPVPLALLSAPAPAQAAPPAPVEPVPSPRQLAWHELEYYAFLHFNMNTFTDQEWGDGTEDPDGFQPTELDCKQWVRVLRDAGMKAVIITAKHHDGFCLWPSRVTDHTVAASSWRNGRGDVLKELSAACARYGLRFGVYLSPWDRHSPVYGQSQRYNAVFRAQLREVLTKYGQVFEVWFDGANGEGPNGRVQVYDWPSYVDVVRDAQPKAVIFSDAGPDVRWVGNERGFAGETNWGMIRRDEFYPGCPCSAELNEGQEDGTHWVPAECDVSIRDGWYYHPDQPPPKSLEQLEDIWYGSIGRGANLLLNVPVDRRGLIPDADAQRLLELRELLDETFRSDLARRARITASDVRPGAPRGFGPNFEAEQAIDGDPETYWATSDGVLQATLTLELDAPQVVNRILLREYLALGQRVRSFSVQARVDGSWQPLARGTTIGNKRILRTRAVRADGLRLRIEDARGCPTLASFGVFRAPPEALLTGGARRFLDSTEISLACDQPDGIVRYTLDGSEPGQTAPIARGPILLESSSLLRARAYVGGRPGRKELQVPFERWSRRQLLPALATVRHPEPGLRYRYYEGSWRSLAELSAEEQPLATGIAQGLDLGVRRRDENFALAFEGLLLAPTDGVYTFSLGSDDGSSLWIGDALVVDHDGLHGMSQRSGAVALAGGYHPIRVLYFNASGERGLELSWQGPGRPQEPVPAELLGH